MSSSSSSSKDGDGVAPKLKVEEDKRVVMVMTVVESYEEVELS